MLLQHLDLVLKKNEVLNLTRITEPNKAIDLHILDSLLIYPRFSETSGTFIDIGTGAGYPGIPLAIMSGRNGVLMDSVSKKITACEEFIDALGLHKRLECTNERAEAYALTHKKAFGAVVARAVAPLGILIEYASPLLSDHGALIVTKGRLSDEECSQGNKTADICGMEIVSRETIELPSDGGHREILEYRKTKVPKVDLPRPIGEAKKHPLAH